MAKFIESIFGKTSREVTLEDVTKFFETRQDETSTLEFKSGNVSLEDLYKSVSGLLNAEGGLLIVGSPVEQQEEKVDKKQKHVIKFAQGTPVPTTNFKTRESITQKLGTHIVPPPIGFDIAQIKMGEGYIYLIDVPQSLNPPHQVTGSGMGIYYFRNDNTTIPASHGVVSALFNQRKQPKLAARIELHELGETDFDVSVAVGNESEYPADKVTYIIDVSNALKVESPYYKFRLSRATTFVMNHSYTFTPELVIPKGVEEKKSFRVVHRGKDFLIYITAWTSTTNIQHFFLWYSGTTKKKVKLDTAMPLAEVVEQFLTRIGEDHHNRSNTPPDATNAERLMHTPVISSEYDDVDPEDYFGEPDETIN
jgi:hypothetical protein